MSQVLQVRAGLASEWTSANPVLALGEIGFERDTTKLKIGNGTSQWSALSYFTGGSGAGSGTVTSVSMTVPTGLSVTGSPITSAGTLALSLTSGYSIPTTASQTNWDTAYTDRNKWDGGSTGLVAATGRTSLGATTVGSNLFTLTNPSAITFLRLNADNTVSTLDAATFRTAIGAGTSSTTGTVTSVGGTGTVSGLTLTGTVTTTGNLTLGGTLAVTASNFASQTANTVLAAPNGSAGVPTFRTLVSADIPSLSYISSTLMTTLGDLIYGGASGASTRLAGPTTNGTYVLTSVPSAGVSVAPTWQLASGLTVSAATKSTNLSGGNNTTLLGSIPYQSNTDTTTLLSPNTSATKQFLSQTGTGTNGAAPVWSAVSKTDVGLSAVENTALSTWAGSSNITTVGTIGTGTWNATAIADGKIASALTGKTYNGLTLTAQTNGFTIAGGTTSKTLTVALDASVSGTNTGDQTITLTGDVTGSGTGSFATALKNTGTAGTYRSVTTDAQGRVTSGTNPTTLSGYGITDALGNVSPVLARQDTSSEGGQINFANALANYVSWYIDSYGTTATPTMRFISNNGTSDTVRMSIDGSNGNISVGGTITASQFIKSGGTNTQYLMADGSISTGSSFSGGTVSGTINLTGSAPQLTFNGTTNLIKIAPNGIGAPTFTSYSPGAKLVTWDNIGSASAGHAIGTEVGNMWFGVSDTGNGFRWYAGTTSVATLTGAGVFTTTSFSGNGASLTSLTAGNLSGTIPSAVLGSSSLYIGTTSIALNRSSASQSLTGVSIDGSSGSVANSLTIGTAGLKLATGSTWNGSAANTLDIDTTKVPTLGAVTNTFTGTLSVPTISTVSSIDSSSLTIGGTLMTSITLGNVTNTSTIYYNTAGTSTGSVLKNSTPMPAVFSQSSQPTGEIGDIWIDTSSYIPTNNIPQSGLVPIVPTSVTVTGSGSSASVASNGKITFTTCETITINNAFPTTYENFIVYFQRTATSTNTGWNMQLALSGTAAATAYDTGYMGVGNATTSGLTPGAGAALNTTSVGFDFTNQATSAKLGISEFKLFRPNQAVATDIAFHSTQHVNSTGYSLFIGGAAHQTATAYDGIKFNTSTAGINSTGVIRIYGYN